MARARKLHRSGSIGDISVEAGELSTLVYGSQPDPYRVVLSLSADQRMVWGIPEPEAITSSCTCPDADAICKHALATVLTFAEEVEADSRLLDEFLGRGGAVATEDPGQRPDADPFFEGAMHDDLNVGPFEPMEHRASPTMLVEATDAWPVFVDAVNAIGRELRR
jgi:hypothetical protein